MQVASFMYSFSKGLLPDLFKDYFIYNRDVNMYKTRNAHKMYIPFYQNNFSRTLVSYKGHVVWNSLPDEFKRCPTICNFKRKYKSYLLD